MSVLHGVGVGLAGTVQALLNRGFVPGQELVQHPGHYRIGQDNRTRHGMAGQRVHVKKVARTQPGL